jgi:hypothetical protein
MQARADFVSSQTSRAAIRLAKVPSSQGTTPNHIWSFAAYKTRLISVNRQLPGILSNYRRLTVALYAILLGWL